MSGGVGCQVELVSQVVSVLEYQEVSVCQEVVGVGVGVRTNVGVVQHRSEWKMLELEEISVVTSESVISQSRNA